MADEAFLDQRLAARTAGQSLRCLSALEQGIDFCSNDYLGLARNEDFRRLVAIEHDHHRWETGSTGSRLLSGNHPIFARTEAMIAHFHHAEAALLFNSGYDANLGLVSALAHKGDVIIYDRLVHASVRDGIRLSVAASYSFAHNDPASLEKKLQRAEGNVFVVVESVYSMDGDRAPLLALAELCSRYGAHLIVDEAHATGVLGPDGAGLVQLLGLSEQCLARVHTFGKALGVHGAAVVGSERLKQYLVNFARPFIFTTAMAPAAVAAIAAAYRTFPGMAEARERLGQYIGLFAGARLGFEKLVSDTPIQGVVIPGNAAVREVAGQLARRGFYVRPILHPTVDKGRERLRVVVHAFNTPGEVEALIGALGGAC